MTETALLNEKYNRRKVMVPATPIILSYLVEHKKATRNDITKAVYNVSLGLRGTNVGINAIFRGHLNNPELGIESETVDSELWYWLSNQFIGECDYPENDDVCFEINKTDYFEEYKLKNICKNLKAIKWNSDNNRSVFLKTLSDVVESIPSSVQ